MVGICLSLTLLGAQLLLPQTWRPLFRLVTVFTLAMESQLYFHRGCDHKILKENG